MAPQSCLTCSVNLICLGEERDGHIWPVIASLEFWARDTATTTVSEDLAIINGMPGSEAEMRRNVLTKSPNKSDKMCVYGIRGSVYLPQDKRSRPIAATWTCLYFMGQMARLHTGLRRVSNVLVTMYHTNPGTAAKPCCCSCPCLQAGIC